MLVQRKVFRPNPVKDFVLIFLSIFVSLFICFNVNLAIRLSCGCNRHGRCDGRSNVIWDATPLGDYST